MNENQGNSVIASGTTRAGANQSYAPPAASSRAPSRLPSTSTSTHRTDAGAPRALLPADRRPEGGAEREHGRRGEPEERRDGDVVAAIGGERGQLDRQREREVAEVVVVEVRARQPRVLRRERPGAVDGVRERHVHRLLGVPHVGRVGHEQRHRGERQREHRLRAPEQARAQRVGRPRPRAPPHDDARHADEHDPARGARAPVRHERGRAAHPHEPRHEQQAQHLGQAEPGAREARQQDPRQRRRAEADDLEERPEAQRLRHGATSSWTLGCARLMPLYDALADLPLTIEGYSLEGRSRTISAEFERRHDDRAPAGRRRGGDRRGRRLRRRPPARAAAGRAGAPAGRRVDAGQLLAPSGRARSVRWDGDLVRRLSGLPALGVRVRRGRPRAAPGRALAGRRAGPRAAADHVRGVAPARRPPEPRARHAPARRLPRPALQARRDARLGRRPDRRPRGHRRGGLARLQGRLQGHAGGHDDRSRLLPPLRRGLPRGVAGGPRPDGARGRRGAAAVPRPDHLGRADPRRGRHRGASLPARDDQRQAVADRLVGASSCARTSGAPSGRSSATAAGSRSWASGAARSSTSHRSSMRASRTTSRRPATTGRSSPRPGCRPPPCRRTSSRRGSGGAPRLGSEPWRSRDRSRSSRSPPSPPCSGWSRAPTRSSRPRRSTSRRPRRSSARVPPSAWTRSARASTSASRSPPPGRRSGCSCAAWPRPRWRSPSAARAISRRRRRSSARRRPRTASCSRCGRCRSSRRRPARGFRAGSSGS